MKKITFNKDFFKNKTFLLVVAVFVAVASFSGLYAYGSAKNGTSKANAAACTNAEACVSLSTVSEPNVVTVKNGSYVQFNSADKKKHNLFLAHNASQHTDHEEDLYTSGDFGGDEAWRVQFKKDGAYTFQDKYNSDSTVNVVVYTEGKDYKIK